MEALLLHNAGAGDEDHSRSRLLKLLKRHGHTVTYVDADEGLRDRKRLRETELVVVAGGDGTVRKAVTQIAGEGRRVAVLPLGTANNIARSLGIPENLDEAVDRWKSAAPRPLDLGVAKGPWGRRYFVEGVGFGLLSRTISLLDRLDEKSAREFGSAEAKLHRDMCVLAALTHVIPPVRARITVEGVKNKDHFLLLEVLNISRAGPGVELAAAADPSDGRLNLVLARDEDRKELVERFEKHLWDDRDPAKLEEHVVDSLRLVVNPCELRIDDSIALRPGDFDRLPDRRAKIRITVEPGAVTVVGG